MSKFVLTGVLIVTLLFMLDEPFTISQEVFDEYQQIDIPNQNQSLETENYKEIASISSPTLFLNIPIAHDYHIEKSGD